VEFGQRLGGEIAALRQTGENGAAVKRPFDLAFQDHEFIPGPTPIDIY
jgi:hypothetical protein